MLQKILTISLLFSLSFALEGDYHTKDQIDYEKDTVYQYMHSYFNFKSHKTNYFLPLSSRLNGTYGRVGSRNTVASEVEFQISVKYDFAPNLLGFNEVYSFAYTQHSFWQYYVGDAFFRASDYNPEFFVTVPMKTKYFKALRFSIAHTSNGLGVPGERSWNYATVNSYFQYKSFFTELTVWYRLNDNYDYNPNLIDTLGYGHVKFLLPYKKHFFTALFRNNFQGKGVIDTSYTYPLFSKSLFLYIKGFAGNKDVTFTSQKDDYVEKIGIGFSISR